MKPSVEVPEMAYSPQHPHRTQLAVDPVLGYRIYPPAPPRASKDIDDTDATTSRHTSHSSWTAVAGAASPPSAAPAGGAGAGAAPTRTRGRHTSRSQISSLAGSLSSNSGDSGAGLDDSHPVVYPPPAAKHHRYSAKPERLSYVHRDIESHPPTPFSDPFRSPAPVSLADVTAVSFPTNQYEEDEASQHSLRICLYLSGFCCLVSLVNLLWVLVAVIIASILQPLRLCSFRQSFRDELVSLLGPLLNMQLRFIYSPTLASDRYNLAMLLVIHIFSPIISLGVAVAAWTSAIFWFYAAILGDPTKTDRRSDGKATVLAVRAWWERWLRRGLV